MDVNFIFMNQMEQELERALKVLQSATEFIFLISHKIYTRPQEVYYTKKPVTLLGMLLLLELDDST